MVQIYIHGLVGFLAVRLFIALLAGGDVILLHAVYVVDKMMNYYTCTKLRWDNYAHCLIVIYNAFHLVVFLATTLIYSSKSN